MQKIHKQDIVAGFVTFLIALPLSLGIAMASGFPPVAGLYSAIIGGLLVSRISGSFVTINGPAAGLIVIVLGAVEALGHGDPMAGYRATLAVITVSGLLLFIAGLLKGGELSDFFPESVVHGMLAAIGVIIFSKQAHIMLGVSPTGKEPAHLLAEIPHSLSVMNPEIAVIGVVSLLLLILWPKMPWKWVKRIPAPLVVVIVGMIFDRVFDLEHQHKYLFLDHHEYDLGPKFLVTLPQSIFAGITNPEWSQSGSRVFWGWVITLTLVQGLETLLSASAVDLLDKQKRKSNLNKDLAAVGFGTAISGFIGGLPMIAEIVRSSNNINNGAKSGWSNFAHGAFMLMFLILIPNLLHQIPLASLAAILVFTGYNLASPKHFKHALETGTDQFFLYTATTIVTVFTDLLIGVGTGIFLKLLLHFSAGLKPIEFVTLKTISSTEGNTVTFKTKGAAVFTNYLILKSRLKKLSADKNLVLDFSEVTVMDRTVEQKLFQFARERESAGSRVELIGVEKRKK
ncbi:MAG: SulP family inorganic anion transporter [Xanthomonadaceae bacterium]|nr:SulP family inorganic anion transporter [Xanthomonadaceae bacterium]